MDEDRIRRGAIALWGLLACQGTALPSHAQSTGIRTEYLMTYQLPVESPLKIDDTLTVMEIKASGSWAKGPAISGSFIAPSSVVARVLPSGTVRIDVRATLRTDDGALIFMTYGGTLQHSAESAAKLARGELLTTKDIPYFVTAPTFQTSSPKYAWLNSVQAVDKVVELKVGEGGYVRYDVFIAR